MGEKPWKLKKSKNHSTLVYILENTPPPGGGGEYQPMSFGGKNMKRWRVNVNVKEKNEGERKRKKGERKWEKGK